MKIRITKHLLPYFTADRKLREVRTDLLRSYIVHRQSERAANATINLELAVLKRAYALAIEAGLLTHRPAFPKIRIRNARQKFFELDQYRSVLKACPDYLQAPVIFAYWTGWRFRSEIITLQWRHVDRAAGEIRLDIGSTKNGEGRILPYTAVQELRELIDQQWAWHQERAAAGFICPWVFPSAGGYQLRVSTYRRDWDKARRRAGVPGLVLHDFRRTAIRNLVRAGVPDVIAMKISGHKTRQIFDRYNIVSATDLREALGRMVSVSWRVTPAAPYAAPPGVTPEHRAKS